MARGRRCGTVADMRFLPTLLILTLTALVLAPLARAVPPPLTASFTMTPEAPAPDEPVTFTSTSFTPTGSVIATEWDLDDDGQFDDGRKPTVTRAFPAGTHTVRLEARLSGTTPHTQVATRTFTVAAPTTPTPTPTATPTATATPEPPLPVTTPAAAAPVDIPTTPVGCETFVRSGSFTAQGECLLPKKISRIAGQGTQYSSSKPVRVNGVTITPAAGQEVLVKVIDYGDRGIEIGAGTKNGTATFTERGETITVDTGYMWWTVENGRFDGIEPPANATLGGLPVVKLVERPQLVVGGARFAFMVKMPQQFGAPTSDKPVRVTAGGIRAAAGEGFHFEVENAAIGPIALHKLLIDYDGDDTWRIAADATLPGPANARVKARSGIRDGGFDYGEGEATFLGQGLSIVGPVFLKRIKFRVEVTPQESECVPNIGVKQLPTASPWNIPPAPGMPEQPTTKDYGVPTFALCGEVGLAAGPTILGVPAIGLDAGLGFAIFDDRPALLRAFGEVKLAGIPLYEAAFELHGDGYIEAKGRAKWVWPGVALMEGKLAVEMQGTKFNAHGGVDACVLDWCAVGARAVVSNAGMAVCLKIDFEVDTWHPGIGYKWGETPTIYFAGCELGPYKTRVKASAAQAGAPRQVTLPAGLPGAAIALVGRDAPPTVTLVGPKGERFTTPTGTGVTQQNPFFVVKDPNSRTTQILVHKPSAGAWKVIEEPGSSPITELKSAEGREAPKVTAKVVRRGGKRVLDYRVSGGGKVTFAERGATAGNVIGVAKGSRGTIAFDPADGRAEKRHIVAIVEQDGLPSAQVAVTTYRAPAAKKPGRVQGVSTKRHGGRVRVSWKRDGAPAHIVTVALSDGRRVVRRIDGRTHLELPVPRGLRAKATVRAVARNGMVGR